MVRSHYRDKLRRRPDRFWYFWHNCFGPFDIAYKYDTWEEAFDYANRHAQHCTERDHGTQG